MAIITAIFRNLEYFVRKDIVRYFFGLLVSAFVSAFAAGQVTDQAPEIEILGGDAALTSNIASHLRIHNEPCDTPLARLERLKPQVLDNVIKAGRALGYYRLAADAGFGEENDCWHLVLTVTPGERIPINEVSIHLQDEAKSIEVFSEILANHPLQTGVPLNHGHYEALKNALSAAAVEDGYFGARFERAEIQLDLRLYQANIHLEFDPGPRYRFGVIRVLPVEGFSRRFIESMLTLETGQPYSSTALLDQRTSLDESQYFRQVSISPQLSQARNQSVPVIIELSPRARNAWSTGIGFTTDTGPRIRGAYENRYVNRRGHKLSSDAAISGVRSQANLGYNIPLDDPLTTRLSFGVGYVTENTDTYDSDRYKLETALRRESSSGWMESYSIDYLRDDYIIDQQADVSALTMFGYSLSKTAADDFILPTKGWRLFGQLRGASDSILSDTSFIQLYTSGKGIMSWGRSRLITRFELGTTLSDEAAELPASVRFFAGGDRSIRGYKYQTLGPRNSNGEVTGGKHLITGSIEYDFPVKNNWRAAIFYDGGNAFSSEKLDWEQSVGLGFRWLSPIGPIRTDLAHALGEEGGFRLHITMGPDL